MRNNNIICKNCGYEIQVEEVLIKQAEETVKQEYEKKTGKQIETFKKDKEQFEKEKKEFEQAKADEEKKIKKQLEIALDEEKQKIKAQVIKEHDEELKKLKKENSSLADENKEIKKREEALKKLEKEFADKQEYAEIEIQKRLFNEKDVLETEIKKKAQERIELLIKEYDKKLADQKKVIEELRQEASNKPKQPEMDISIVTEDLRKAYPEDEVLIEDENDILIEVSDGSKNEYGKIMIRVMQDEMVSDHVNDFTKHIKERSASLHVLAAKELSDDVRDIAKDTGVLVTTLNEIMGVVFVMRGFLIKEWKVKREKDCVDSKKDALGNYLKSDEFKDRIQGLISGFTTLKEQIDKEKRAMLNLWEQREKQIQSALENTVGVYGAVKGIGGKEIKDIKELEL